MSDGQVHSPLGGSIAHRWINCPGSVAACRGIEDRESVYAAEGTAAHTLAALCLDQGQDADYFAGQFVNAHGLCGEADGAKSFVINDDMIEAVQVYLDEVNKLIDIDNECEVEVRFDLTDVHEDMYGTADISIYKPAAKHLITIDYKHGRGVPVEVKDNNQGLFYALGAALRYHNRGLKKITIGIVQPRCPHPDGPVRTWDVDPVHLLEWAADLRRAAERTEDPDAPLSAGDWCKFCPAAPTCPALREKAMDAARADFTAEGDIVLSEPKTFNGDDLAKLLGEINIIEDWCRRVREHAHHEAEAGRTPPGFKLVPTRATRKWKDADNALTLLKLTMSVVDEHLFKAREILTPAQMEKVLRKHYGLKGKRAPEAIAEMVEKVSSGTVLAPLTDAREKARPEAAEDFAT